MSRKGKTNVVICGVGHGAHALAGISSMDDELQVTLLALYKDKVERWSEAARNHSFTVNLPDGSTLQQPTGSVRFTVTKDLRCISSADIVVLCLPAFTHHLYLKAIAPLLPDSSLVVGMPGQPGFEFQCKVITRENGRNCNIMSLSTLPWTCRIKEYGREVDVSGTKDEVEFSYIDMKENKDASTVAATSMVQRLLGKRPVLRHVTDVIRLTLSTRVSFNPPLVYSKWHQWDGTPVSRSPVFYQGVDEDAVACLRSVTQEILDIAGEIGRRFPSVDMSSLLTMQEWLVSSYDVQIEDKTNLITCLRTNSAYDGLCHPMVKTADGKFVPDLSHRYITEDVPYGLVVLRQIADFVDVKTPMMDKVIQWAQTKLNRKFLIDGVLSEGDRSSTRLPTSYGITSIEQLMHFFTN